MGPTDGSDGGGAGGCVGTGANNACWAQPGTAAGGGSGAAHCAGGGGGGGGGGWFGGGGGGGRTESTPGGAGGGGGSSYAGAGALTGITIAVSSLTQSPEMVISYTLSTTALAAELVSDSTGEGPGTALADMATAIEADVVAGDSASACTELSVYLRKVADETGKKLTAATAAVLTDEANALRQASGC